MLLGSFVVFGFACLLLLIFPPAAFVAWLVSVVMFFAGLSARSGRKERRTLDQERMSLERERLALERERIDRERRGTVHRDPRDGGPPA